MEGYGPCRDCGAPAAYEMRHGRGKRAPTWYWCKACHDADRDRYDADKAARDAQVKAEGTAYWHARGLKVGAEMRYFSRSWTGFGGTTYTGTARVGVNGPYVHVPGYPEHFGPDQFHPATK